MYKLVKQLCIHVQPLHIGGQPLYCLMQTLDGIVRTCTTLVQTFKSFNTTCTANYEFVDKSHKQDCTAPEQSCNIFYLHSLAMYKLLEPCTSFNGLEQCFKLLYSHLQASTANVQYFTAFTNCVQLCTRSFIHLKACKHL